MGINKKKLPYAVVTITHLTDLLIFCHCRSREQSCRAHDGDHDGTTCRGWIGLYAELWPCKVLVCCFQLPVVGTHEADSGRPAAGWLDVGVCGTDDKRGGCHECRCQLRRRLHAAHRRTVLAEATWTHLPDNHPAPSTSDNHYYNDFNLHSQILVTHV